jgi:hypothetical protein
MKLTDLTAQLEQESNETIQQAKQIEREALSTLESDLKQQCSSAATTLKSALDTSTSEVKNTLSANSKELTDQLATLKKEVATWTPRMIWAVKWGVIVPVIATFAVCGLMIVATWLWMPKELWNVRMSHQTLQGGKSFLVIEDASWTLCNISDTPKTKILRPCKTIGTEGGVTLPAPSNPQQ